VDWRLRIADWQGEVRLARANLASARPRHDSDVAESAIRNPQFAIASQSAIPLDRNDPLHARGEDDGHGARPRSDLDDDVAGRGLERVDDLREELRVA